VHDKLASIALAPMNPPKGTPSERVAGRLEMYARSMIILTFGGGTNEIQRDLIAIFGLGMPRSLR
jgi:3-oxocholest-4-en-26-oyl-CoA dehydrogenase alpha subunit